MLRALWNRVAGGRRAVEQEAEREHMSESERRFVDESVEDRQADAASEEWLGGIDPKRLIDDDSRGS